MAPASRIRRRWRSAVGQATPTALATWITLRPADRVAMNAAILVSVATTASDARAAADGDSTRRTTRLSCSGQSKGGGGAGSASD